MTFEEWYEKDENEDWFANEAGTERDIAKFAWDAALQAASIAACNADDGGDESGTAALRRAISNINTLKAK